MVIYKKGVKCPQRRNSTSFKKGHISWMKDKKHKEESIKQMHKKRIEWHKTHEHPRGMLGKGYLLKGHEVTKKTREKIGEAQTRLIKEGKKKAFGYGIPIPSGKGEKNPFYGEKHTEKMRKELSEKKFKHYEEHPETIEKIKKARAKQIFPIKDTKIEVKIQNFLKKLGIEFFTHQYMSQIKHAYQCDILIPYLNLVIECDGDYWHKYPIGNDIDHIRTKELIQKGFRVLRLWEFEINEMSIKEFNVKIRKFK